MLAGGASTYLKELSIHVILKFSGACVPQVLLEAMVGGMEIQNRITYAIMQAPYTAITR